MAVIANRKVRFEPFELDAHASELYKHGLKLKLQGHPIQILAMLLERPGELITREEIQQKLWPSESETFVDFEHGLNTAVRKLRQTLGDEAETPQYIETLPRRGYRFVGEVAKETPAQSGKGDETQVSAQKRGANLGHAAEEHDVRKRGWYRPVAVVLSLIALLALGVIGLRYVRGDPNGIVVTGTRQLTHSGMVGLITGQSEQYGSIQTDGRRVYFAVIGDKPLRFVSVNGGEEAALPSPVANPVILHISPDGATLIVREVLGAKGRTEGPLWLVEANGGAARKLGDIEAQDAAFAPDGKTIVVAIGQTLYVTDTQGTKPVKLAEVPGRAFWLRWSPDGERLRFSVKSKKSVDATLWELNRQGKLKQAGTDWSYAGETEGGICCGVWTRDGKHFLLRRLGQYWTIRDGMKFGHAEPRLLTTSGLSLVAAATSPLTNTVFVEANLETRDSLKLDPRTGQTWSVDSQLKPVRIEYSADGQWIAYLHKTSTVLELWRARSDGSDRRQLTAAPMRVYMARFSPDGRNIAFMASRPEGPWKIYWVSVGGGALHEVRGPVTNQGDPNWSPDGQSILYGQAPESWAEPGVPRHLYVYDLRTEKTSEIEGSAGLFSPRWSPDGRYVAAIRVDFQGISMMDWTTGKWQAMVHQSIDEPFWSLDSKWLYFSDFSDTELWRISARDGRLESVLKIPVPADYSNCDPRRFAPDGLILLNCRNVQGNVFALDLK